MIDVARAAVSRVRQRKQSSLRQNVGSMHDATTVTEAGRSRDPRALTALLQPMEHEAARTAIRI